MKIFIDKYFDKILLFALFLIVSGMFLREGSEFSQGLVSTVLGAIILALTGRSVARLADGNGNGNGKTPPPTPPIK